jgi:hypothetical protein
VSSSFANQRFSGPQSFPQKHIGVLHNVDPREQATSEEVTALLRLSQSETAGAMGHLCGHWDVYSARGDRVCEHLRNRIGPFTYF